MNQGRRSEHKHLHHLHNYNYTDLELPEAKTADDIKDVSFQSGDGVINFKDETSLNEVVEAEDGCECFPNTYPSC